MTQQRSKQMEINRRANMILHGFGPEVMKSIKVCQSCGNIMDADEHFCTNCGKRISKRTLFEVYQQMHPCCSRCGTVAPDDAEYCPKCGAELIKNGIYRKDETHGSK